MQGPGSTQPGETAAGLRAGAHQRVHFDLRERLPHPSREQFLSALRGCHPNRLFRRSLIRALDQVSMGLPRFLAIFFSTVLMIGLSSLTSCLNRLVPRSAPATETTELMPAVIAAVVMISVRGIGTSRLVSGTLNCCTSGSTASTGGSSGCCCLLGSRSLSACSAARRAASVPSGPLPVLG